MQHSKTPIFDLSEQGRTESQTTDYGDFIRQSSVLELFPEIVGRSHEISSVLDTVSKIAVSDGAVLVTGESGTGKELIAQAVHRLSNRKRHRFVAINCSAIPEDLLESELFGHEKGAFTGAVSRRIGLFEQANGGSLFLDEIGEMPMRLQSKLLRVLQERRFTPIGSRENKQANVRIIAATNVDLQKAVTQKEFRLDLFYRLNVLPVHIPALREREDDIVPLVAHFLERCRVEQGHESRCRMSEECLQSLLRYEWPGNIRELQNLIERLTIVKQGELIEVRDLPSELGFDSSNSKAVVRENYSERPQSLSPPSPPSLDVSTSMSGGYSKLPSLPDSGIILSAYISEIENSLITQALTRTGNNKNQAAKLLGMNRTTLVERLKKQKKNN